jgi:RimJ/RimL family protein N-acetyltransferase
MFKPAETNAQLGADAHNGRERRVWPEGAVAAKEPMERLRLGAPVASSELDALNEFAGARVRLRGVRTDDIDAFIAMDADTDGARRSHDAYLPRTDDRSRAWLEQQVTRDRTDDTCFLAIERLDSLLVGSISVGQAKPRWGRFSHGLAIAASDRRQGFGTEAVTLLLRFYFGELRYQKCDEHLRFQRRVTRPCTRSLVSRSRAESGARSSPRATTTTRSSSASPPASSSNVIRSSTEVRL